MNLRVLEYFLTVADEENISHAAEDVFRVPDLEKRAVYSPAMHEFLSCFGIRILNDR